MAEADNNEKILIFALRTDDPVAYRQLYEHYAPRLQAFAAKLRMSGEEADEIVQETFIRIWLHRHKIDPEENFGAFVITIARNLIYNQLRKSTYRNNYIREISRASGAGQQQPAPGDREIIEIITAAMAQLPEKCRQVFRKSRLEGYSNSQIAEEMKISKSTVENQLNKALKVIRKNLENNGYNWLITFFTFFFDNP